MDTHTMIDQLRDWADALEGGWDDGIIAGIREVADDIEREDEKATKVVLPYSPNLEDDGKTYTALGGQVSSSFKPIPPVPLEQRCDPSCPGWVTTAEMGIEKCDDCGRFDADVDAFLHVVNLRLEDAKKTRSTSEYYCTECDGTEVHIVDWTDPNNDEIVGDGDGFTSSFTSACHSGQSWCVDCEGHTVLGIREKK